MPKRRPGRGTSTSARSSPSAAPGPAHAFLVEHLDTDEEYVAAVAHVRADRRTSWAWRLRISSNFPGGGAFSSPWRRSSMGLGRAGERAERAAPRKTSAARRCGAAVRGPRRVARSEGRRRATCGSGRRTSRTRGSSRIRRRPASSPDSRGALPAQGGVRNARRHTGDARDRRGRANGGRRSPSPSRPQRAAVHGRERWVGRPVPSLPRGSARLQPEGQGRPLDSFSGEILLTGSGCVPSSCARPRDAVHRATLVVRCGAC